MAKEQPEPASNDADEGRIECTVEKDDRDQSETSDKAGKGDKPLTNAPLRRRPQPTDLDRIQVTGTIVLPRGVSGLRGNHDELGNDQDLGESAGDDHGTPATVQSIRRVYALQSLVYAIRSQLDAVKGKDDEQTKTVFHSSWYRNIGITVRQKSNEVRVRLQIETANLEQDLREQWGELTHQLEQLGYEGIDIKIGMQPGNSPTE